ncbi:MAG: RdgB/HAM1 family non-canonical purine NTP pyrophosphatase [Dehalococcoidia bacterium]
MKHRLLIASSNPHKIREFRQIIDTRTWDLVTPAEAGVADLEVAEEGSSYRENAATKARAYANASGLPALADDSGLEVDALGGAPGIHSARYAGLDSTDAANRAKLLRELAGVPPEKRSARFRAVVAISFPYGPDVRYGEGSVEGRIAEDERGVNGFGYDPVFELADGRRLAELPAEEKNAISHRARAAADARQALEAIAKALDAGAEERERGDDAERRRGDD